MQQVFRLRWGIVVLVLAACSSTGKPVELPTDTPQPRGDPAAYTFVFRDDTDGLAVRYNPCQPVHYVVNPTDAPRRGVELVQEAVALVEAATGIDFIYDGEATEVPPTDLTASARPAHQPNAYAPDRWAPVLIGWIDLTEEGGLTSTHQGSGGSRFIDLRGGRRTFITGSVTMNSEIPGRIHKLALMHELGHLVGLGHVEDDSQVMAPFAPTLVTRAPAWGAGDLAGLALVGRPAGCLPETSPGATGS